MFSLLELSSSEPASGFKWAATCPSYPIICPSLYLSSPIAPQPGSVCPVICSCCMPMSFIAGPHRQWSQTHWLTLLEPITQPTDGRSDRLKLHCSLHLPANHVYAGLFCSQIFPFFFVLFFLLFYLHSVNCMQNAKYRMLSCPFLLWCGGAMVMPMRIVVSIAVVLTTIRGLLFSLHAFCQSLRPTISPLDSEQLQCTNSALWRYSVQFS